MSPFRFLDSFWGLSPNPKFWHIILWWELARIPYNMIMVFAGLASFYIAYVTIPLVYEIIGLLLNCFFTIGWIAELTSLKHLRDHSSRKQFRVFFFWGYLAFSVVMVFCFSVWILI